ncbi:MAG TPA: glycosyltransferase family A protein [Anaerolineales bacterium]|nr:glycosyltransferase family A protein [Anaerolineales bacterium]HMX19857.1 glycosyltransferase family A protein [Anaerolineales bacterium]HMX76239.1 glycosyltransferase family A protein [Anaerolineales bacterium]HMZ42079.1 glycosyltransferase family A protein [Anaerolineales bacterium]HND90826.1 glycosyltransferase family A protein [Anaerolineales bacterium]
MRKGQNPAKFVKDVARPERITVALLNYIPFLSGFYAETLDVLKVSLESMRKDAGLPFDLMVFDNGSCEEVREFLIQEKEEGRIQYLILSEKNMGKGGAWNVMLAGAPGEIIAYTDSDVLFSPTWLSRSVELLEAFPNVGMVTARPYRTSPEFYSSTLEWARNSEHASLDEGQFIPWETFLEFNLSLGQTVEENEKVYAETKDWRIQYKGMTALAGASHWQFTAYKSTLQKFLPFDMDKPMGQVRQLDKRMNDAGLLRLMVSDPLAMNMSNTLGYLRGELGKERGKRKEGIGKRVLELPPIKKILLAVYNRIFSWYYS